MEKYFYFAKVKIYDSDEVFNFIIEAASYNEAMNKLLTNDVENTEVEKVEIICGFSVYESIPEDLFTKLMQLV